MTSKTPRSRLSTASVRVWEGVIPDSDAAKGFATVLPVLLLYLIISVVPILFAVYASLHFAPMTNPNWTFVGIENYVEILSLDRFWASLWRGVVFMVGSTVVQVTVGLWLALILNAITRGQKYLTAIVFTAYLVPTVVVVLFGLFAFNQSFGLFHTIGAEWLGLWGAREYVLGSTTWAMPLVVLIGSWKFSVFITIFVLAQLRSIPARFYEAARVCGANRWRMFVDITFPRIKGIIATVVLLRGVFMFNKFDLIWMITQGGPGYATTTLPVLAYRQTFQGNAYGMGNALAVVMFLFLAAGAILYFQFVNPSEEVET